MKRRVFAICLFVFLGILLHLALYILCVLPMDKGKFCLDDYSEEIRRAQNTLGKYDIPQTYSDAYKIAEMQWSEDFSGLGTEKVLKWYSPYQRSVYYDPQSGAWLVTAKHYLYDMRYGEFFRCIISSEGEILMGGLSTWESYDEDSDVLDKEEGLVMTMPFQKKNALA